jgi:hypothetical protein
MSTTRTSDATTASTDAIPGRESDSSRHRDADSESDAARTCAHQPGPEYVHEPDPEPVDSYCSIRCKYRALARSLLATLRYDHRFCANCYRQIRDVEPPKPDYEFTGRQQETKKAAVGFATPTQHTIRGVDKRDAGIGLTDAARYRARAICECGATHHLTVERPVSKQTALAYGRHLADSIRALRDEYLAGSPRDAKRAAEWDFSYPLLMEAINHLKSQPDKQGDSEHVFVTALATALRNPWYGTERGRE